MTPEVTIEIESKEISIVCKDCEQEFVLKAVSREEIGYQHGYEPVTTVLQQARCDWCPFCGESQREPEEIEDYGH